MSDAKLMNRANIIELINDTHPTRIATLDFVRDKFIQNYNACNRDQQGELMYHRQLIHFNQIINGSDKLKSADRFSLYACFVTAAANGYSLDPADNVVYLIPKGGKAHLWRQAGAHVHRLIKTNQIRYAEQAQLVYKGDTFTASKGKVLKHDQNFMGDEIIAAYQEFVLPDGQSRFFIYRTSDWESWRSKSDVPNGPNWNFKNSNQPEPGFLKTKITKHACMEKVWATGMSSITPDSFQDVEIESDDLPADVVNTTVAAAIPTGPVRTTPTKATPPVQDDPEPPADKPAAPAPKTPPASTDEDEDF